MPIHQPRKMNIETAQKLGGLGGLRMNDFDLFANETEIIECPHCQETFSLDDIESIDEQIKVERMIENERQGILVCTNDDCKKPFYFEGFIEYRYASKKLESENAETQISQSNNGWISVDDDLPKQKGYYLIYCFDRFDEQHEIQIEYFSGKYFITDTDVDVLYWQPLPQPPKER